MISIHEKLFHEDTKTSENQQKKDAAATYNLLNSDHKW